MPKTSTTASTTATQPGLPEGFVSPFTRVEMEPNVRIDDGLACVAMLTNQTLADIKEMAIGLELLAPHGPAWIYADALIELLQKFGLGAQEKSAGTVDALPSVCVVSIGFDPSVEFGRWGLFHHVKASDALPSFNYVMDPAYWIPDAQKITMDVKPLFTKAQPIYYLEITPKPASRTKAK